MLIGIYEVRCLSGTFEEFIESRTGGANSLDSTRETSTSKVEIDLTVSMLDEQQQQCLDPKSALIKEFPISATMSGVCF